MTAAHKDILWVIFPVLKLAGSARCPEAAVFLTLCCFFFSVFFHLISGVLKDYLRELPYPLITKQLYEAVLESMAVRPLRMGAAGCENDQADSQHTVSLLEILPEVERVRQTKTRIILCSDNDTAGSGRVTLLLSSYYVL